MTNCSRLAAPGGGLVAFGVYDLEIVDNHNFALDAGVFVHNSKDMSDSLAGALWNATLHKEDLIDGLELLNVACNVNEFEDTQQSFINDMQNSMLANAVQAHSKLDELMSNFGTDNIISW